MIEVSSQRKGVIKLTKEAIHRFLEGVANGSFLPAHLRYYLGELRRGVSLEELVKEHEPEIPRWIMRPVLEKLLEWEKSLTVDPKDLFEGYVRRMQEELRQEGR